MGDYLKLIDKGGELLGLQDDLKLIRALVEIGRKWAELADEIGGGADAKALLAAVVADVDGENVVAAFDKLGLSDQRKKLSDLLKRVDGLKDEIPEKYWKLLEPVSKYDSGGGEVAWTLIDAEKDFDAGGDFTFGLSTSSAIAIEAGAKATLEGVEKHPLLKIGANTKVGAKGGGKAPFLQGSVKVGAESSIEAALDYYFSPDPTDLYALAVAERIVGLPNPFDYDSVWAAFASDELKLSVLTYTLEGASKANVEISLADTASFGADLVAELAMSVSAAASVESEYTLTLSAGEPTQGREPAGREIRAVLARKKLTEAKFGLALNIDVDLSKLAGRVHDMFQKAVNKWDSVLNEITPFLSPGTYIQGELSELLGEQAGRLIGDDDLKQAVVRDLRGVIGIDTADDSALAEWLSGELTGAIDSVRGVLNDKSGAAVDRVTDALANRLPAFGQADIVAQLKPAILDLLAQADGKLEEKVKALVGSAGGALGTALQQAGAQATAAVASADQALASVRAFIDKYDKLIHDLLDQSADVAKAKISLRLSAEELKSGEEEYQIAGTLTANSDAARKVFHALTRGDPAGLAKLLAGDTDEDDFELDRDKSSLRRYSKRLSKAGVDVVMFGFAASGQSLLTGEATYHVDGNGKIHVDSKGAIEKRFKGPLEAREVSFVDTFSLLRARIADDAGDQRSLDIGVSVVHHDDSLKLPELEGFIESLEERGLLPAGTGTSASQRFASWAGGNKALPADLSAKLWLSKTQAETLMALDQRTDARLSREASVAILAAAIDSLFPGDPGDRSKAVGMSRNRFSSAVRYVRENFYPPAYPRTASDAETVLDMEEQSAGGKLAESWRNEGRIPPSGPPDRGEDIRILLERTRHQLQGLLALVQIMGEIYLAQPEDESESPLGWNENTYVEKQHALARGGQDWIRTGQQFVFWASREVQPWTVALLRTIARLSRAQPGAMSLTLTRRAVDGARAETVELARGG